jgi:hypothetical protein
MARFLENHDEPRAAAVFGKHRLPAAATVIATLPGLRFFHEGQFEGRTIHLSMPLNSAADEPVDRELVEMYERVLRLGNEAVYHGGEWKRLDVKPDSDGSWENLIAYRWRSEVGYRLIIVNLSSVTSQGRVYVTEELPPAGQYVFSDKLSGQDYVRDRDDIAARGLYVRLDPYRAHVFSVAARQAAGA